MTGEVENALLHVTGLGKTRESTRNTVLQTLCKVYVYTVLDLILKKGFFKYTLAQPFWIKNSQAI